MLDYDITFVGHMCFDEIVPYHHLAGISDQKFTLEFIRKLKERGEPFLRTCRVVCDRLILKTG